jgi:hypothetical protein
MQIVGSIVVDETLVKLEQPSRKILTIKVVKIHWRIVKKKLLREAMGEGSDTN